MVNGGDKGKKRARNYNSNVENITNAVAELRRRYDITTSQAVTLLKNMPGPSRRHRATNAAQRVMGSRNLVGLLASKMNSRQLAMFAMLGTQPRDAAKRVSANRQLPSIINTAHGGTRTAGRTSTLKNRKTLGLVDRRNWAGRLIRSRITARLPGAGYAGTTRALLLAGLQKEIGFRLFAVGAPARSFRWYVGFIALRSKLRESLYALTLNSRGDSSVVRDLQRFVEYLDTGNNPASVMNELGKLGKMALYIISVHLGIPPAQN